MAAWVYALLFLIVFVETGVVVMPFLPGRFAAVYCGRHGWRGACCDFRWPWGILLVAAILGDQCNYTMGRMVGPKVFQWEDSRWFNRAAFEQGQSLL